MFSTALMEKGYAFGLWRNVHAYDFYHENCHKIAAVSFLRLSSDVRSIIVLATQGRPEDHVYDYSQYCCNGFKYTFLTHPAIAKDMDNKKYANIKEYKIQLQSALKLVHYDNQKFCR